MLGTTAEVETYKPYLDENESLKSTEIEGIKRDLVEEIANIKLI